MLKAIETKYKGYRFRSRLEARWAVFFDSMGIVWEYEKEGFELNIGWYLPDFWLPQVNMWAEVKPVAFTEIEVLKLEALLRDTKHRGLMLVGIPDNKLYSAIYWAATDGGWPGECEGVSDGFYLAEYILALQEEKYPYKGHRFTHSYERPQNITSTAVEAARSARFEHGETPAPTKEQPKPVENTISIVRPRTSKS